MILSEITLYIDYIIISCNYFKAAIVVQKINIHDSLLNPDWLASFL